ncbi:unnamed protein product [Heterobilharzia americana]|nr:unnamed protein product [Heterobilharzia americana]
MRVTRYLWINNLPARVTEQDIRDVLQSHGKIQSVRIHEHEGSNGAVVAFVDTKSATRAVESTVRLKKVNLSLQYCESSGVPGTNSTDQLVTPTDYTQASSTSLFQSDGKYSQQKSRSVSTVSDSSSVFHDPENKEQSQACSLSHTVTNRNYPKDSKPNMNTSPRFQNEHRGLKISHLPLRSSDTNLREGLFHEYKKHGKITSVFVRGQDEERICIITFKRSEDAERALASSKGKVFFGTPISVHPHEGLNSEDPDLCPPEHALDEYHPKATKTLFVGNLCSGTITQDELRRAFRCYGEIIEIDIKIQANQPGTSYAFIQYWDIKSVVRALQEQETIRVNGKPVKLGFGKSQPTNVVWLDNLSPTINETFLTRQFGRYGQLTHVVLDRKLMRALLYFDNVEVAQHAVNETRNRALVGRKVQIDYAGYECQVAFMRKLAKHDNFGQVYENYKERLQEVLSLLPYGAVIPYLGDRQRHFGDSQRDHFPSGNTKFSYRRSNCIRGSPVDRPLKYEQSNRNKCGSPVSPRSRSHQSDRRRTFITSSPDDYRLSTNWVGSHNNRNSHHGKSDLKSLQIEDRPVVPSHRKYQHNDIHTKSKSLRYLSQAENKSGSVSRSHIDQSNSRNRGQLLEETDDVSSGSFSSGYTNDDSFFEASSLRHSHRGGRGKGSNYTPNVESSSRKRAPSSLFANDLPSPKLKCVESTAKCDFVLTQSPTFISDGLTSPGTKKFTSNSHSLKRITTSHDSKCSILTSTQEGNDKHVYVLSTESHSNRNDATSPSQKNPLAKPPSAHDIRSLSASSRYTALSVNTITHGLDLSVSRPSALMTSSPRMLVPPEPTSPMIHISPPSSPIVMDKSYASTPNAFLSSSVPTPSTSGSIASSVTNSCSRDPRLAVHINQLPCDVPPPPPETFKLPLWVDTSPHADVISNSISSSVLKPQSPLVTKSIYDVDHGVSIHDSSVCSLDERIRLLDVQLMKSEKARPTVDYSKFRIRRKTEAGSTSQSTQSNGATQCISGVSVISCSPHSPVLTVSTYSVSTRHELAVTDNVNPSLPVSSSATTVPKSPILSSTTPLSLVKPADTSEFVKSMLSFSKPSPSTPCNDTPNNLFSNEVMPVARHPATVSLCTNSFLSRLPRSIVNSMSSTNSIQSSDSFCNKLPIANNNRIHATVCNLEHSSLSGAQPVGVATRMPSVRLSCVSDILSKAEDNDLVAKCNTKLNTRKESMDYVEKCESSILPNSVMNTSTDFNVTLPLIVSDNQKSVDITGKITEPSASSYLGSASALPVKTNQKLTSSQSVACSKSSPQDDLIISDSCKPTSLSSLRSALDDFVFQNSLGSSTCKTNRLKKQLDCSTLLMPTKRKPTTTFEPKETVISNVDRKDLGNLSLLKIKAPEKTSSKNVSKKSEFVPESNMQKDSTPNCKPQLTSDDSQSTLGSNNRLLSSLEKKTVSPHSRKRKIIREIKKKTIDSEDSDWEQNAVMSSNSCDLLDESNYESMYDKIKRRANQSTTKSTDSLVKPSVLQRLFKVKGKQSKKADTHKSPLDSDTDECLSDGSSNHSDNTSTVVSKRTGKSSFLSNETLGNVDQFITQAKRIVAQSEISSNESSHKTRSRRAKKSEVLDVSRSITIQVKRKHKGELQKNNASGYRSIRRKKLCITEENDTTHGNESKTMSGRMSSTVRLRSQKQRNVSSESKRLSVKNSHRSLVHRVFASTDSSSLSSSVMSEASEDEMSASNNQVSHSVKEKTDKKEVTQEGGSCQPMKSKSPSPRMSRSCSPEDLRADAAIRHTFGAFTAPFMCLKTDSPCNAVVKQSAPQTSDLKFSPNFEDSRPTPPTLPMTDSSFSGDQYSNGGITTKSQIRDHSDWNIFSSLAKQSTPIKDDSMQQNLSSSGRAVDSDSTPANAAVDMSYDTEDELPCLEKHDDDELNNPYESSILLHESDSFSNNTKNLNVYNDDDLPPPVVSEVDQLSYSDTVLVSTGTVSDIIEEVIYDSLEVPVSDEGHLITDTSIKSDLCENFPIVTKSIVELTLSPINEEAKQPFLDACSASNTDVSSLHGKVSFDVSSVVMSNAASSVNSVTIQSTALNSVTMSATPQPSDLQNTHQPMLVAVPTTSAGNLSSSKLALLTSADNSGSNSCSSLSSSVNSVSQCHIAVILPTTSVSLSGDSLTAVSSVVSDSHISATPNVAVTKPGYPSLVVACSPPPFTCVTLTSCQSLHPPTTQTSQAVTYSQTTVIAMPSVSSNSSLDNGIPTSHPCLASESQIGNTSFDPSDFTSYVQRVIERVKQEKDEEILQQREKVKRPRRNANISMSSASTSINYTNIIATVTSPSVFSPITTALSSVISSPSVSATDVLKSQSVSVFDDKNVMISMCSANSSTAQECNPISIKNTFSPNPQSNSILDSPSATNIQTPRFITDVYSEQNHLDSGCNNFTNDSHSRDPVDETIEAVVNGEFDEKEYVLKLLKGAFVPNGHYRTLSGSIGSPSSHSDTVTLLPENSSMKGELNQPNVPESVYAGSPNSAFNIGVHSSCPMSISKGIPDSIASTCQSSTVLTPMHVLTFVAASTATCTSQNTCTSTAISPIVSTQSVSNLTNSAHHISSSLNSSSSGLDKNSNITPLTAYATIPNSSDSLSTNSTNTCIGEFAARLANNPFTTYFYSLLTQKQLSPSLSPSISSGDSLCQRPNDNMTLPLCPSTTLKNLSIPNASVSGDTADYLAAATMAAMAAMTGPTQDMTSFAQTEASESYPDHKAALSENQFLQMWSAAHLRIQEYPVIWRGRLSLKNEEVFVNMHYISGNQDLMKSCMGVIAEQVAVSNIATSSSSLGSCVTMDAPGSLHQPLKIVQRMRLETSQLEGVQRKLRQINDFCMCLTLAAPPPLTPEASVTSEQIRMNRILCDGFIKYMLDKCAAGIINVCHPCTQQNLYVIHIFPPCDFSRCQLQVCAPALSHSLMENSIPHVLTVITTV